MKCARARRRGAACGPQPLCGVLEGLLPARVERSLYDMLIVQGFSSICPAPGGYRAMTDPSPTRPARTFDELFAEHHLTAEERTKLVWHYESTQDRGDVAVCARPTRHPARRVTAGAPRRVGSLFRLEWWVVVGPLRPLGVAYGHSGAPRSGEPGIHSPRVNAMAQPTRPALNCLWLRLRRAPE